MNIYVKFLNSDFSVDIASIFIKSGGNVLYNILEGKVSQNFDLGPGYGTSCGQMVPLFSSFWKTL